MTRRPPRSTLFPYTTLSRSARPAYEPARLDVVISVPKDRPRGSAVLRNARIVTMKGNEVIERGDVIIRDKDRKSTRLNSSHANISYAVFCLKKKKNTQWIS